jgi:hypothetical protein
MKYAVIVSLSRYIQDKQERVDEVKFIEFETEESLKEWIKHENYVMDPTVRGLSIRAVKLEDIQFNKEVVVTIEEAQL